MPAGSAAAAAHIMKADTFAKLVVLETLVDAEIGHFLEDRPPSTDSFREGLVARISDLVDEIDEIDALAAARVYDAIVDFLAELPEDDEGVVGATLRFKRAAERIVQRGMEQRELRQASTWAVVLEEVLDALADEYHRAVRPGGEVRGREYLRALTLLARAREVAERMQWEAEPAEQAELRTEIDRLTFAVRHQRLKPTAVDSLIRAPQRRARAHRPTTLTRIGTFVVSQLLRRRPRAELRTEARAEPRPAAEAGG